MKWYKESIEIQSRGKGLYPCTEQINRLIRGWGIESGMCHLFLQHTSASLVLSESYDPSAARDLESFMNHLVPEGEDWHQHTLEGPDDSPSHMRSILTATSLSIPIDDRRLNLGTWQGVYLFEHRKRGHQRVILVRCIQVED